VKPFKWSSDKNRVLNLQPGASMTKHDPFEAEILDAYESGKLKSVANKGELNRLRAAARATAIKDRRVNIRLSAGDLQDIQARALAEGMPYQTLIASVLHKYVTGRLEERKADASHTAPKSRSGSPRTPRRDV
jgi:predicted DNA binding CopG/RHH family protein